MEKGVELVPLDDDKQLSVQLDVAKRALAEASEQWERIQVRDYAKAVEVAAAVLERKDIAVYAANLVQDAERAVFKALPEPSVGRPKKSTSESELNNETELDEVDPKLKQNIRAAHKHVSDEEFEVLKEKAVEEEQPLTRKAVKAVGLANSRKKWGKLPKHPSKTKRYANRSGQPLKDRSEGGVSVQEAYSEEFLTLQKRLHRTVTSILKCDKPGTNKMIFHICEHLYTVLQYPDEFPPVDWMEHEMKDNDAF